MGVLLMRLAGPMQSWGIQSRFSVRDTGLEPSKSGVIGLLCAAMGRPRHEPVTDLASLRMAVRVDHEGRMARDYQTAQNVIRADGRPARESDTVLSQRYYLADANFLVGLEGEISFLQRLDEALRNPVWQLSLGRKSFVPGEPIFVKAPVGDKLRDVLVNHEWEPRGREASPHIRYVWEVAYGRGETRRDVPVSFADRKFGLRHVMMRSAMPREVPDGWEDN
jgi:CRISPR system Cascade subunit CasD